MSNMSQEEIEAMMAGLGTSESSEANSEGEADGGGEATAAVLEAYAARDAASDAEEAAQASDVSSREFYGDDLLSVDEKDILGEIGNICMGTSATTMYMLLGKRVNITTPNVALFPGASLTDQFSMPFVVVDIAYTEGIPGNNLFLLEEHDAILITDLLMGGEGIVEEGTEMSELHLSAICEIMNQMVGSSSTSLSNLIHIPINISPPTARMVNAENDVTQDIMQPGAPYIKISFKMEIEDVLESELMQIMPLDFGKTLVRQMMIEEEQSAASVPQQAPPAASPAPVAAVEPAPAPSYPSEQAPPPPQQQPVQQEGQQQPYPPQYDPWQQQSQPPQYPPQQYPPQQQYPPPQYPPQYAPSYPPQAQYYPDPYANAPPREAPPPQQRVDVRPVSYPPFDSKSPEAINAYNEAIDRIVDVPLQVSVELGKSKKSIKEILEFTNGTVIMLDRLAGDPVDVIVNGKLIARGEVVVIDESYGVRITEIITPTSRTNVIMK